MNYYKLLGLYGKTHSEINLDDFNELVESLGFSPLPSEEDIVLLLNDLKEGSKEYEEYLKYKSGEGDPIELLISRHKFIDNNGTTFKMDTEDIIKLIKILQTNQELKNGNFNVKQFNKAAKNINGFRESEDLLEYIFDIVDRLSTARAFINDSDNQVHYVNSSSFDIISRLNMKQRELQNLSRKYNKLKRETLDSKLLQDKAISELKNIKLSKPIKIKKNNCNNDSETLLVGLSDIHVGLKTSDFNKDILKSRLNDYVVHISNYIDTHNVSNVIIVNIGDSIENIYMHLNQMSSVELNLSEQVAMAIKYIVEFIQDVRHLGIKTSYVGIAGNHDRLNPNIKQNIVGDGVNTIINAYLKANQDIMDINYIESDSTIRTLLSINGINIAVTHGDYDKVNKPDIISKLSEYFNKKVDIVLSGHLHNLLIKTLGNNQYVLQSGSMFTGNPYSDSLGVTANASQIMIGIDKNSSINIIPIIF